MMTLFGLNSFDYWFGMFLADFIIVLIPASVASIILLCFDTIMEREFVWEFFFDYVLFGTAVNCFSYLLTHVFSDPDSAIKNLSLIYIFGMFIGPFVVTMIVSSTIGFDDSYSSIM